MCQGAPTQWTSMQSPWASNSGWPVSLRGSTWPCTTRIMVQPKCLYNFTPHSKNLRKFLSHLKKTTLIKALPVNWRHQVVKRRIAIFAELSFLIKRVERTMIFMSVHKFLKSNALLSYVRLWLLKNIIKCYIQKKFKNPLPQFLINILLDLKMSTSHKEWHHMYKWIYNYNL